MWVGRNPMTGVLIRQGQFGHGDKIATGRWRQNLEFIHCKPRNTKECWQHWKLEEARKDSSPETLEGVEPY